MKEIETITATELMNTPKLELVKRQAEKILKEYPDLRNNGFNSGEANWNLERVSKICDWILEYCQETPNFVTSKDSYEWKHDAELEGRTMLGRRKAYSHELIKVPGIGDYIPQGEFILAALVCNIPTKKQSFSSNAIFKMKFRKDLKTIAG